MSSQLSAVVAIKMKKCQDIIAAVTVYLQTQNNRETPDKNRPAIWDENRWWTEQNTGLK